MFDNWFSITGSKELWTELVRLLLYRKEERQRLRGEAMAAEGKGYQEMLRAADMATTAELNRLTLIQKKAEALRAVGMGGDAIKIMSEAELAKLERVGQAFEVLRKHTELGMITGADVEELPPPHTPDVQA